MTTTAPLITTRNEFALLLRLQRLALGYFLDNQLPCTGLVLDRQRNFGAFRIDGLISTAATGMGLFALALASAEPYHLLSPSQARLRIRRTLETALGLPHTAGVLPHFLHARTGEVVGWDARSTIDGTWLLAGALWSAEFLDDGELRDLANTLYDRVDWRAWTAPCGLLHHGARADGRLLPSCWDRVNGETVLLHVLAAGAAERAWPAGGLRHLRHHVGEAGGLTFASADLGLFVFQYGYDLLDFRRWRWPDGRDLMADAAVAAEANARVCREASGRFATYRRFWGLSAGDGPGGPGQDDVYRCFCPAEMDGTAHLTASAASVGQCPARVWENLFAAAAEGERLCGRYGLGSVNTDQNWVASDMVGIDAGALVLALDNVLFEDRVRRGFHALPQVKAGLERLGCRVVADVQPRRAAV